VRQVEEIAPGVPVHATSARFDQGFAELSTYLEPGRTVALLGSSGVGKSTLINRLLGRDVLRTREVRHEHSRGRHTTTHRELVVLPSGALVIDTRKSADYAVGHVPGTINIPLNSSFTTWAGWLVPYTAEFYVLVDERRPETLDAVVRDLAMIGLDRVGGYFDTVAVDALVVAGRPLGTIQQLGAADLAASLEHNGIALIDVRNAAEWRTGHIAGARHIPLGYLADELDTLPRERTIVVQCQGGSRSAIGASLLRAHGFDRVVNFTGGMAAWVEEGRKLEV